MIDRAETQRSQSARLANVHALRDEEKLRLHLLIAETLLSDPARILAIASANLRRWQATAGAQPCYEEWERILATMSPEEIAALIVDEDETGRRLRQSTPFVGVLPRRTRDAAVESG